jgi:hypothetical protein
MLRRKADHQQAAVERMPDDNLSMFFDRVVLVVKYPR